jgi:hypothetical protein
MNYKIAEDRYVKGKFYVLYKKSFLSRWKYIRASNIGLRSTEFDHIWVWTSQETANEFITKELNRLTDDTRTNKNNKRKSEISTRK